jgi:hypothetical protein
MASTITYGNTPHAEAGYQNTRAQVDNSDSSNAKVSFEVPFATGSVIGILQLTGDFAGTYLAPLVAKLQGTPVSATSPTTGQVLQIVGGVWTPHTLVAADIPSLDISKITTGILSLSQGGTGQDLSSTGGTTKILAQNASHVISARNLVVADLPLPSGDLAVVSGAIQVEGIQGKSIDPVGSDGSVPTWVAADNKIEWFVPFGSSVGTAGVRTDKVLTTASIAGDNLSLDIGTVTLNRSFLLVKVQCDRAARVRLYETAAARLADTGLSGSGTPSADRPNSVPPTAGTQHGVICDLYLDTSDKYTVWRCSPEIPGNNNESSPTSSIQYAVTNLSGSAHTVQVTFSFIGTEPS